MLTCSRWPLLLVLLLLLEAMGARAQPSKGAAPGGAASPRRVIYLQPLGKTLPAEDMTYIQQSLKAFYAVPVKVLPRVPLPTWAYYPPRKRYRAERLLELLGKRLPADGLRILGVTAVDISTTKGKYKDWGVLGLANLDGTACVISKFRCRRGARDAIHTRIRLGKVAVHEIGHTLGLEHCPTWGCLLEDARGRVDTCDREYDLCASCRRRLKARGYALPGKPAIPWPKPRVKATRKAR